MKIALVIERMDTSRGGRETSTAQIAASLAGRGNDVTVLCQSGSWQHEGVKVLPLGRRGLTRSGMLRNFADDVRAETDWADFDVVHGMLPVPGINVYQPRSGTAPARHQANLRRRTPHGRQLRRLAGGLNRRRVLMAEMERQVLAETNVWCLPPSRMVADEIERYYRRTDRVRVVFNAVDVPQMSDRQQADSRLRMRAGIGADSNTVVFLTIATNWPLKGAGESIAAFAGWHRRRPEPPNARLVLVGCESRERYQRIAASHQVADHVLLDGPTEDVAPWYAAADVCVLLSWYDPCSRVVLEATRLGVPSITTAFNGASEALADGAGLVVPSPADTPAVIEALETMYDGARRAKAADACRRQADWLAIDRHVDELLTIYAEATAS